MWSPVILAALVFAVQSYAEPLRDPLPISPIQLFAKKLHCPKGKSGININRQVTLGPKFAVYYTCGGKELSATYQCSNGYKASYRRDLILKALKKSSIPVALKRAYIAKKSEEPNYGFFAEQYDNYNTIKGGAIVYACLSPKK